MGLVTFTYNLQNGQLADADQVMANLNTLLGLVNGNLDRANLSAALQGMLFDVGDLKPTAKPTAPSGWLLCDGSAVSRSTYADLWNAIRNGHAGTGGDPAPFGNGDGSSTFNVPDLRGRVPVGAGTGSGLSARALGAMLGEESHALTYGELPEVLTQHYGAGLAYLGDGSIAGAVQVDINGAGVTGGGHNTMQPSQVINWLVKT